MADNVAITAGTGTTVAADDIGGVMFQRVKLGLGADGTANDAVAGAGAVGTGVQRITLASDDPAVVALQILDNAISGNEMQVDVVGALPAGESTIGGVHGWGFDVTVAPTVTNGAYSAGDVVGGLLTFADCSRIADEPVLITGIQVTIKAAVLPVPTVVFFSAAPTVMADNAAYSISAADSLLIRRAVPIVAAGGTVTDHGTPNTYSIDNLAIVMKPASGTRNIVAYLIDTVGVTLTSTSDIQVRLTGLGV